MGLQPGQGPDGSRSRDSKHKPPFERRTARLSGGQQWGGGACAETAVGAGDGGAQVPVSPGTLFCVLPAVFCSRTRSVVVTDEAKRTTSAAAVDCPGAAVAHSASHFPRASVSTAENVTGRAGNTTRSPGPCFLLLLAGPLRSQSGKRREPDGPPGTPRDAPAAGSETCTGQLVPGISGEAVLPRLEPRGEASLLPQQLG